MGKNSIAQAQYGDPPDARPIIYLNGIPHYIQRINLLDLIDWLRAHHFRRVGPIGGPNTWPPAILYERIDDHD